MRKRLKSDKICKDSIESIILRDLARSLRIKFPAVRFEAHPLGDNFANLFATISHQYKISFTLVGKGDEQTTSTCYTVHGDGHSEIPHALVYGVGDVGVDLAELSKSGPLIVCISDPDSTDMMLHWMHVRVQALLDYVDTFNNNRPTKT